MRTARSWTFSDAPSQAGRTVLITGANSGIGRELAAGMAAQGARVLLACRNLAKATVAQAAIASGATGSAPEVLQLDLADLASVRICARNLVERGEQIDALVLNAGVMDMPKSRTKDGFEMHFGTNHLGHFAFAGQTVKCLRPQTGRIVVTSSLTHHVGRIDWRDPNAMSWSYSPFLAYAQSKLANLLFLRELDRRYGHKLLAVAAHPGSSSTNLATQNPSRVKRAVYGAVHRHASQPAAMGALPLALAATMPVTAGSYWGPGGPFEIQGPPVPARRARAAKRDDHARHLWDLSEALTGVRWPGSARKNPATTRRS